MIFYWFLWFNLKGDLPASSEIETTIKYLKFNETFWKLAENSGKFNFDISTIKLAVVFLVSIIVIGKSQQAQHYLSFLSGRRRTTFSNYDNWNGGS